jgi:hypothetical protein
MMKKLIKEWVLLPIIFAVAMFLYATIAGLGFSYGYLLNKDKVLFVYMKDDPVKQVSDARGE